MSVKTIYISGKVRGLEYKDVVKKFARKQEELETAGYKVVNLGTILFTGWAKLSAIPLLRLL